MKNFNVKPQNAIVSSMIQRLAFRVGIKWCVEGWGEQRYISTLSLSFRTHENNNPVIAYGEEPLVSLEEAIKLLLEYEKLNQKKIIELGELILIFYKDGSGCRAYRKDGSYEIIHNFQLEVAFQAMKAVQSGSKEFEIVGEIG